MVPLADVVKEATSLRGCNQLDEIGAAVPNSLFRQGRARQKNSARVDTARSKRRHDVAQVDVANFTVRVIDQPNLLVDPEHAREREWQMRGKCKNAGAAPSLAQHQVQRQRAAIAEAHQHEPGGVEPMEA